MIADFGFRLPAAGRDCGKKIADFGMRIWDVE